jgi:transposase
LKVWAYAYPDPAGSRSLPRARQLGHHKTKLIWDWLLKRPRYHAHFTPTSASWINQVERWFALLTERALRRAVHHSVAGLERDIRAFVESTNAAPKPFRWIKSIDDILVSVKRFCLRNSARQQ